MQVKKHLIYGLADPRTGELRYVGRSSSGLKRPRESHGRYCQNWVDSLKKQGIIPRVLVLEELDPTTDVDERLNTEERKWVAYCRSVGTRLTNLTDGGEKGRKVDESTRKLMRAAKLGEKNHFFGKRHDDATKLKMRSPVVCLDDGLVFPGLNIAASHYGVASSSLSLVCNGKRKKVGGLRFAFVENVR